MNFEEFIKPVDPINLPENTEEENAGPDELDVQRTVVEVLAAEKAEQEEQLNSLRAKNESLQADILDKQKQIEALKDFIEGLKKKSESNADKVRLADANIQKISERLIDYYSNVYGEDGERIRDSQEYVYAKEHLLDALFFMDWLVEGKYVEAIGKLHTCIREYYLEAPYEAIITVAKAVKQINMN